MVQDIFLVSRRIVTANIHTKEMKSNVRKERPTIIQKKDTSGEGSGARETTNRGKSKAAD